MGSQEDFEFSFGDFSPERSTKSQTNAPSSTTGRSLVNSGVVNGDAKATAAMAPQLAASAQASAAPHPARGGTAATAPPALSSTSSPFKAAAAPPAAASTGAPPAAASTGPPSALAPEPTAASPILKPTSSWATLVARGAGPAAAAGGSQPSCMPPPWPEAAAATRAAGIQPPQGPSAIIAPLPAPTAAATTTAMATSVAPAVATSPPAPVATSAVAVVSIARLPTAVAAPIVAGESARAALELLGSRSWSTSEAAQLTHRGLLNTGNACFRSAVLQALLALDPLTSTALAAAPLLADQAAAAALPTWAQLCRFTAAFEEPPPGGGGGGGVSAADAAAAVAAATPAGPGWSAVPLYGKGKGRRTRPPGPEPVVAEETLAEAFGAFRSHNAGEQEDAHEFFAFLVDRLHEEIAAARALMADSSGGGYSGGSSTTSSGGGGGGGGGSSSEAAAEEAAAAADDWQEVGKGRTRAIVTNQVALEPSVVTSLFYGWLRSEVRKGGSATLSVALEPFQCLQLDLEPPPLPPQRGGAETFRSPSPAGGMGLTGRGRTLGAAAGRGHGAAAGMAAPYVSGTAAAGGGGSWARPATAGAPSRSAVSLQSALEAFFSGEELDGVKGGRDLEVRASKSVLLDRLPHVLTLHLKQFRFDPLGGARKLCKSVLYPIELELNRIFLSTPLRATFPSVGPRYGLRGVIFHHGRGIHGGHYTACCRDRRGTWRRYDDQSVSEEPEAAVLRPEDGHPYLLVYERLPIHHGERR